MKKLKYVFNEQTLRYEQVEVTLKERLLKTLGYTASIVFTSLILTLVLSEFFPTVKERALNREITQMEYHYSKLSNEYEHLTSEIDRLQDKDAEIHRVIFGIDPVDNAVWEGGTGGVENIVQLVNNRSANDILGDLLVKAEKLKRKIEIQNESLDTILNLSIAHETKLSSIPSIKPVQEDVLKRRINYLSGYGWRIHPIHKVKKFHKGIDFTAPKGTPIQASGDGRILRIQNKRTGYGKNIVIDHGYGFQTLYAHLQDVEVKEGQRVKKGQRIGTIGSSGTSTAPHLHYEVHLNDNSVNPIDYVLDGLSPEEYHELVKRAEEENQSFD
jgi:murein DD-endopeptidase MepM/ murein hydrolase activator NlpD